MSLSYSNLHYDAHSQSEVSGDSEEDLIVQTRKKKKKRNVCLFVLASSFVLTSIILIGIGVAYQTQATELQQYPGNEEISQIMENISASLAGVANSSIETVGLSVENNPIRLLRISPSVGAGPDSQVNNSCASSPLVWVVCGVHAREWISPLACLEIIKNIRDIFLDQSGSTEDEVLKKFRYNFIVMANPDGYIYSMSDMSRRMTRKNRAKAGCSFSNQDGVDLNRNFATGFNHGDDCYGDPCPFNASYCSITYGGPHPFSEPETRAIRDAMTAEVPWLSLSLHGNGNVWSAPYASQLTAANGTHVEDLEVMTEKLNEKFGSNYSHGCSSCVMYRAGGTLSDWVYEDLGVNRSYLHELKALCDPQEAVEDEGKCLFQPDIKDAYNSILPETWYGFKELLKISHEKDC